MSAANLLAILPLIVLAAAAVLLMLVTAFHRSLVVAAGLAVLALLLAAVAVVVTDAAGTQQVTPLLVVDNYARFYMGLIILAATAVALLSYGYLNKQAEPGDVYFVLLLLATLGCCVLVASAHFASFFLGLEILSVALYAMIGYTRSRPRSIEAGIKYLVLAAASAAFLLFGIALIYAFTGTMQFAQLAALRARDGTLQNPALLAGIALLIVGFGFKLALVPFHMWTPDVYEGAPAPATAFVASASKGAMFALLLRYFTMLDLTALAPLYAIFAAIAVASILGGNLLALLQTNVKRVLAYSSIAHLGYLLVAFLASGTSAIVAVSFYLVAYFVTILGAFGVVTVLSRADADADSLDDYRGLFWSHPWLAMVLTACLLSLAGLPLTAGFVGKFNIVMAAMGSAESWLAIVLVIGSAIGLYYYLRIIVVMFLERAPGAERPAVLPALAGAGSVALAVLTIAVIWFGIYPTPLINLIENMATHL